MELTQSGSTLEQSVLFRCLNGTLGYVELHFLELSWKSTDEQLTSHSRADRVLGCIVQVESFSSRSCVFEEKHFVGSILNEKIEMKAWLGCKVSLKFAIGANKKSSKPLFLSSDPFVISPNHSSMIEQSIYSESFLIGDAVLVLSYSYFPNQFSFPYLATKCFQEYGTSCQESNNKSTFKRNQFASRFLVELQSLLRSQAESSALLSADDSRTLLAAVDYLYRLIAYESKELVGLLEGKSPKCVVAKASAEKGDGNSQGSGTGNSNGVTSRCAANKPSYSVYHVAHVAKCLLRHLQEEYCDKTVPADMILIDKLQSVFLQTLHCHGEEAQEGNEWMAATAQAFLLAVAFWFVQQQLCNENIFHQFFDLEPEQSRDSSREFSSLLRHFHLYDSTCTQTISWSDLPLLLQDLGGADYSREEILAILKTLDEESCGLIEFGDFMQWWCSEEDVELSLDADGIVSLDLSASTSGILNMSSISGRLGNGEQQGKGVEEIVMDTALFTSSADEVDSIS